MMDAKKPILVTGSPRSGTTWIGQTIAAAPAMRYVHEPFNISRLPCRCGVAFDYWFYHVAAVNECHFLPHLTHILHPGLDRISVLNLLTEMYRTRRIRPLKNYTRALFKQRPVVKAPLALFSAPWLAYRFNMDVVVVIRHPAAVVNSYKTLNWSHSFGHFFEQPILMEEQLSDFGAEITDFAHNKYDIIDQVALLWKLIHYMVLKYQQAETGWIFVRHEDLARDPAGSFHSIFAQLQLPLTDRVLRTIQQNSADTNPLSTHHYAIRRNSEQTVVSWKETLTAQEIDRIRMRVEPVSQAFFKDEEW